MKNYFVYAVIASMFGCMVFGGAGIACLFYLCAFIFVGSVALSLDSLLDDFSEQEG